MMCNLWHIKQTNGLFYYALEYVRSIEQPVLVLVRQALLESTRCALPQHDVRAVSLGGIISHLLWASLRRRWVFTPTAHPFPLNGRQLIVVHDDYPFVGNQGRLRRLLFQLSLWNSRCQVGHINHSTSLQALKGTAVPSERLWYMPNRGPNEQTVRKLRVARAEANSNSSQNRTSLRVALFGSDSRKKRYEDLFLHSEALVVKSLSFLIYGHPTDYYHELRTRFRDLDIRLVSSSEVSMEDFLRDVDVVASVAEHEGFGRPIAMALAVGIPCFLLTSPVFSEFFGRSAQLNASISELLQALRTWRPDPTMAHQFEELPQIQASFQEAARRLRGLADVGRLDA
jgi:hypothetical protein